MQLQALWDLGAAELSLAGISEACWQAELLLRFVTGLNRAAFLAYPSREVDERAIGRYRAALRQRALGVPLQYIVGYTEFFGREFRVTPAVLIPRPDTEVLVEEALRVFAGEFARTRKFGEFARTRKFGEFARTRKFTSTSHLVNLPEHANSLALRTSHSMQLLEHAPSLALRTRDCVSSWEHSSSEGGALLDLCTGSGCIGLTLAAEVPELSVYLTDISDAALAVAADNAARLGVSDRVQLRSGDLFGALVAVDEGMRFGLITANPPYIPSAEIPKLAADVQREPRIALDGGEDGLTYYRRIVGEAPRFLVPGGWLLLEIGCTQADEVKSLLASAHFTALFVRQDLAGRDRVVGGRTCQGTSLHP
jgi:release factor glutamine methyltransferase